LWFLRKASPHTLSGNFTLNPEALREDTVLRELSRDLRIVPADLHKGTKKLWQGGFMDSVRVDYKKPMSKASETMDEDKTIKEHDPDLYEVLQTSPLLNSISAIRPDQNCTVSVFSAKPGQGYLAFLRYSEKKGDTDFVINEILRHNQ
jgi:hypothetical protein